jgi:hypothetical protein
VHDVRVETVPDARIVECVGHSESMRTAVGITRAGGAVGRVGLPQETTIPNAQPTFYANITIAGGLTWGAASDEILTTRLLTPRNRHRAFGAFASRDESRGNDRADLQRSRHQPYRTVAGAWHVTCD